MSLFALYLYPGRLMPSYFNAVCDTIFDTNQFVIENGVFVLSRRDSMIELKNIHINLSQNGRQIIEDFSFTLNRGEKAVIIGEEGNGKSTLLKFVYNEKLIDSYCEYSGTVIRKGRLAYLPQEIDERYLMYLFMNIFKGRYLGPYQHYFKFGFAF